MIEILKDEAVYKSYEAEPDQENDMLRRAKTRVELLTRDNEGEFTARIKPVEQPE